MSNPIATRLTLTGPAEIVDLFFTECVRVPNGEGEPILDFDVVLPMPEAIRATLDEDADEDAFAFAEAKTGCYDAEDWRSAHWGVEANSYDLSHERLEATVFDCIFWTDWVCPIPVIRALATRYPALSGTVVSDDPNADWSLIGVFGEGVYSHSECAYDLEINLLSTAHFAGSNISHGSALALIETIAAPGSMAGAVDRSKIQGSVSRVFDALWRRVGRSVRDHIHLARDIEALLEIIDERGMQAALDHMGPCPPAVARNVAYLLDQDRMRTSLDRDLMEWLATHLRDVALHGTPAPKARSEFCHGVVGQVLRGQSHDDLLDWACVAMYRPGVSVDLTGQEGLRESVVAYAERLLTTTLDHLQAAPAVLSAAA